MTIDHDDAYAEQRATALETIDWIISHINEPHVRATMLVDVARSAHPTASKQDTNAAAGAAADSLVCQLRSLRGTYADITTRSVERRQKLRGRYR